MPRSKADKNGKEKFISQEVVPGNRVVFRGHLKNANPVRVGDSHCFMHAQDLVGILADDADLDLALPYDN